MILFCDGISIASIIIYNEIPFEKLQFQLLIWLANINRLDNSYSKTLTDV